MSPSMNRRDSASAAVAAAVAAAAQTNGQTAAATPNQVGGAGGGGSGGSFGNREAEVRVVPFRTVIAAVPASSGNRLTSDHASRGPMGIMYPVLARVQHMGSGNLVVTRPQGSDQPAASAANSVDLGGGNGGSGGQSLPETLIQQESIGIPGVDINGSAFGEVNMTDSQGISSHIQNNLQQFLGTMFPGENIQVVGGDSSSSDRQGNMDSNLSGNLPTAQNADNYPATTTTTRAGSASVEGTFLSNLLREIMPIISENREAADSSNTISPSSETTTTTTNNNNNNNGNRQDSAQDQEDVDRGTSSSRSNSRNDPPSSEQQPNPKRQRRC